MLFVSCDGFGGGDVVYGPPKPNYEYKDAFITISNTSGVSLSVSGVKAVSSAGEETSSVSVDIPVGETKKIDFRVFQ